MISVEVCAPPLVGSMDQMLSLSSRRLPSEMPVHLESRTVQPSMTQPRAQLGPMAPGWKAVGGAHCVATFSTVRPRTVMKLRFSSCGKKPKGRTEHSVRLTLGSTPGVWMVKVVRSSPTCACQPYSRWPAQRSSSVGTS